MYVVPSVSFQIRALWCIKKKLFFHLRSYSLSWVWPQLTKGHFSEPHDNFLRYWGSRDVTEGNNNIVYVCNDFIFHSTTLIDCGSQYLGLSVNLAITDSNHNTKFTASQQDRTAILGGISPIFRRWYPICCFSTHMFMDSAYFCRFSAKNGTPSLL